MFYRASLFFGAFPLVSGTAIFVLWLWTKWEWLVEAGLYLLIIGTWSAFLGGLSLIAHALVRSQNSPSDHGWSWRKTMLAPALILSNIPVAFLLMFLAAVEIAGHHVSVSNEAHTPISFFGLYGPGVEETWTHIAPGDKEGATLYFSGEGSLMFSAVVGGTYHSGYAEGYVTSAIGGQSEIRLTLSDGFAVYTDQ